MDTNTQSSASKDAKTITFLFGVVALLFLMANDGISSFWRAGLIANICLSFIMASMGNGRKIGYSKAFFASFLLSPIVGCIMVFNSQKLADEEYKNRMLKIAENNVAPVSVVDQLQKLNELRKEGVLSDEEFNTQKARILEG